MPKSATPKKITTNSELTPMLQAITENTSYEFTPGVPVLKNADKIKELIDLINKQNENLIIPPEEIKLYTGRNNKITQLKKFSRYLLSLKRDVHCEATKAYANFDSTINELTSELDKSIDNLASQVNRIKEENDRAKLDEIQDKFNHFKEEFDNTHSDDYNSNMLLFENWFDKSKMRLSKTALNKDLKEYFVNQFNEYQKYKKAVSSDQILNQMFEDNYEGNASDAYLAAQERKAEFEKYQHELHAEQSMTDEEKIDNQSVNTQSEDTQQDKTVEEVHETIYYFSVNNPQNAKMIKDFCEKNNIEYNFKSVMK